MKEFFDLNDTYKIVQDKILSVVMTLITIEQIIIIITIIEER